MKENELFMNFKKDRMPIFTWLAWGQIISMVLGLFTLAFIPFKGWAFGLSCSATLFIIAAACCIIWHVLNNITRKEFDKEFDKTIKLFKDEK